MRAVGLVAICAVGALAGQARANPPSEDVSESTFHGHQFGLSARLALGYRALFTADNHTFCGVTDTNSPTGFAQACTGRSPLALDVEAAYGVARSIELIVELRIGLEKDFDSIPGAGDGPHVFHVAPGARFFFSEAKHAKLFVSPMAVFDFTGYKGNSFDFGLRSMEGVWIDLHRAYGIYFFIGETIEFAKFAGNKRWLDGDFEAGFGFQGRYP